MSQTVPLYVLVYGLSSLFLGLLFRLPIQELRKRAAVVKQNAAGGTGTFLKPFATILMCIASLMEEEAVAGDMPERTLKWLDTFPQSMFLDRNLHYLKMKHFAILDRDFQAIRKMLQALQLLQGCHDALPERWLFTVEDAIDALEGAESYLFTGKLG